MAGRADPDRRSFLKGRIAPRITHISSAVISTFPDRADALVARLEKLPDTEVRHVQNGKIVIVMEAFDSGEIGSRLATITTWDGVLTANLVFEQTLDEGEEA